MLLPWEIHSSLTNDRLILLGDILRRSRDLAARDAKPMLGDTLWSIGCVAYERSRHALSRAAVDEYREWLSVEVADHHLLVKIGMVPTRFYRGFPERPIPERAMRVHEAEERAIQLAFDAAGMAPLGSFFRFEVETTERGFTKAISFLQLNETGERECSWPIPRFIARPKMRATQQGVVKLGPVLLDSPNEAPHSGMKGSGESA